jgi:hypothetical protein
MTDEGDDYDDGTFFNVARIGEEENEDCGWQDLDDSWLEMEAEEGDDDDGVFYVNAFTGREDARKEEEFIYYSDVSPRREEEPEEKEEGGWWTPDPSFLEPEEEDEEEVSYMNKILSEGQRDSEASGPPALSPQGGEGEGTPQDTENREEREVNKEEAGKTRKPRKKTTRSTDGEWEIMRKDAWLRVLLTSSSEVEGEAEEKRARMEEKYVKFDESSRWIKEAACPPGGAMLRQKPRPDLTRARRMVKGRRTRGERRAASGSPTGRRC